MCSWYILESRARPMYLLYGMGWGCNRAVIAPIIKGSLGHLQDDKTGY